MSLTRRAEEAPSLSPSPGGNESGARVLVVEDESLVARLLVETLESSGYRVRLASDGEGALEMATDERERPDLLVTDFALPGISGVEVARRLSSRWPGLRVLLTSGYAHEALSDPSRLPDGMEFLPKPFTPRAFLARISSLLAG